MRLMKDMCFWELAPSSMVHTLGRLPDLLSLPDLLNLFFACDPTPYGLGVEQESFGGLVYVVLAIEMHYL